MGNCQASDAATVVVEHPGGKVERLHWQRSARDMMVSNPGHYVAMVTSLGVKDGNGVTHKQIKLLRPDDVLTLGASYRLVTFEEVLKEFSGKGCMKLNKLLSIQHGKVAPEENGSQRKEQVPSTGLGLKAVGGEIRTLRRQHQWRPALQSISENGIGNFT